MFSLSFRPLEASIPDRAPVKKSIIGESSAHAESSLGETLSIGCTTNKSPYMSEAVLITNVSESVMPTIMMSRALISLFVYFIDRTSGQRV